MSSVQIRWARPPATMRDRLHLLGFGPPRLPQHRAPRGRGAHADPAGRGFRPHPSPHQGRPLRCLRPRGGCLLPGTFLSCGVNREVMRESIKRSHLHCQGK